MNLSLLQRTRPSLLSAAVIPEATASAPPEDREQGKFISWKFSPGPLMHGRWITPGLCGREL